MTKKFRDEADAITSIRQYLVVNRLITGCQRGSLDLKDWGTDLYLKGVSDSFGCDHRLQLIVCFDQGDSIFFFEKSEDRMEPKIVAHNLLSKWEGEIGLIKRDRHVIGESHPHDLHYFCPFRQLKAFCNAGRGGDDTLTYHTGRGPSPDRFHVLDETC